MSLEELLDRKIDFLKRLLAEVDELQDLIKDSFIFSVEEVTQTYTRYYRNHLTWHGCYAIGHLTGVDATAPGARPITPDEFETRLREKLSREATA